MELHAIVRRRWGKRTWRCISTSTVQTRSSMMCNSVIHVAFKMYTLRGPWFCPSHTHEDRIHCPSFNKLHIHVMPMPVCYQHLSLYEFNKMGKPFYLLNVRCTSVLHSVSHPMYHFNKMIKNTMWHRCVQVFPCLTVFPSFYWHHFMGERWSEPCNPFCNRSIKCKHHFMGLNQNVWWALRKIFKKRGRQDHEGNVDETRHGRQLRHGDQKHVRPWDKVDHVGETLRQDRSDIGDKTI